jgi:DNA-binding MarR family transcriptional regulator
MKNARRPIFVELTQTQRRVLTEISKAENRAEAAIIQDMLDEYIAQHKPSFASDVFGLWKHKQVDGREYQDLLRSEW